jgi:serine/threonine protein kinase/Flp pilus assembly protein TadD
VSAIDVQRWQRASPHLDRLLDLSPTERDAYLGSLCAEDSQVAADVEALLAEHRLLTAEGFLDSPAAIHGPQPSLAGVTIGAYRLLSPIGHGGMGSVWLAERSDGRFTAAAAVKLLNIALLGRSAEQRFTREGTILARLTHPHIGRLIDAGLSSTGQPYLVLEYVNGRFIDRYCDEERLGANDRIRLFLDVQSAVTHAHANLIVHRDLKPSNVLVTTDGTVKLLDFGIAKLIEAESGTSAFTILTREGEVALTPKYAAPEQVTGGPITTATDVYALGVILFELLTGRHPTAVDTGGPAEFVRAIADREPLRLSAAVGAGTDRGDLVARAASRATTPDRLRRVLQGDLETILAKALKTNAAERYASVAEFADDLRRYLEQLPVAARPDSFGYRAAKFVRRHRRVLAAFAAIVVVIGSLVGFYTARLSTERDRARLEAARSSKLSELLIGVLTSADPYRTPDPRDPNARHPLDIGAQRIDTELAGEPELQARILTMIGRTYERMGLYAKALPILERAVAVERSTFGSGDTTVAQSLNDLGVLYRDQGDLAKAESLLRESLALRRRLLGSEDKDVAVTLVELARVLNDSGRVDEAEPAIRESLTIRRKVFGEEHRETAVSKAELGRLLMRRGDLAGAEPLLRQNVATTVHVLGADHPNSAAAKSTLAQLLMAKGEVAAGEALLRESVEVNRRVFGPYGVEYAQSLNNLAIAVEWQGRLADAQALFEASVRIALPQLGATHPRVQACIVNLARVRIARGDGAATESSLRDVLSVRSKLYPPGDWRIAQARSLLGAALMTQRRYAEAEPLMVAADSGLEAVPGIQERERVANRARLATLRRRRSRPDEPDVRPPRSR